MVGVNGRKDVTVRLQYLSQVHFKEARELNVNLDYSWKNQCSGNPARNFPHTEHISAPAVPIKKLIPQASKIHEKFLRQKLCAIHVKQIDATSPSSAATTNQA